MKALLLALCVFSAGAFAQDAFEKEHCESNAVQVNLKTGETIPAEDSKLLTGSDLIEWKDGGKLFKITLQTATIQGMNFDSISQLFSVAVPGAQPNVRIMTNQIKSYRVEDYKIKVHTANSKLQVTTKAPNDWVSTDVGTTTPKLPDIELVSVDNGTGQNTSTSTQLAPSIAGDIQTKSSVTVCTDTTVTSSDVSYPGLFAGAKAPIATFTKQHTATMTLKKALTDCQAKPNPKDCSVQQKKYDASAKARENLWASLINPAKLPTPKRPSDGSSTVEVPGDTSCGFQSQCPLDYACINNKCVPSPQCRSRSDCFPNESCVNGTCQSNVGGNGCRSSSDCNGPEQCVMGVCTSDSSRGGCHWDSDCQDGKRCGAGNICE